MGNRLVNAAAAPLVADVVTLFPEMFVALTHSGVTRRALEEGRWSLDFGIRAISPGQSSHR
jgi:tRNA (guanine37-N1)-methyltransferase